MSSMKKTIEKKEFKPMSYDKYTLPDREALARVVDPDAWSYFDSGAGQRYDVDLLRFDQWKQSSLAKADAIIALIENNS